MKLTIPTPCSENWDAMTPTECGRFCKVCQKEVIDVTEMEDTAILQRYEENGGNLCIRARAEQITPVMTVRAFPIQRLAVFALAVWLVFTGGLVSEVQGQTDSVKTDSVAQTAVLKGKINMYGESVMDAKITLLKGIEFIMGYTTDEDGMFRLENLIPGDYNLKVSTIDTTVTIKICLKPNHTTEFNIELTGQEKFDLYAVGGMGAVLEPLLPRYGSPRRTSFDLQDIRRIPNNR